MRRKYIYIIIGWSFVFAIYSLLLFLDSNKNDKKKSLQFYSDGEIQKENNVIPIYIPGFVQGKAKIPFILKDNLQQKGVYKKVISLLLEKKKDKRIPVPEKVRLNEVFFVKGENGIVLDFNEEMVASFPGGTRAEFEFLNYFSDNVFLISTYLNSDYEGFEEINWISFLSAGNVSSTISGHIDIEKPFFKKSKITTPFVNLRKLQIIDNMNFKPIQRIFIDPGHGGENTGIAIEYDELIEKDITLLIGKSLKRRIVNTFGIDTILTRNIDKNMSIDSRTSKANNQNANLFISIHVNYSFNRSKSGAETYITSFSPIIDNRSNEINKIKPDEIEEKNLIVEEPPVDNIIPENMEEFEIWNRTQEKYISESYKVAQSVQTELNKINSTSGRKVRQLPIRILSSVSMPAVLIEVAFLSNRSDREKLKQDAYISRISNAIFRGISFYISSSLNQ